MTTPPDRYDGAWQPPGGAPSSPPPPSQPVAAPQWPSTPQAPVGSDPSDPVHWLVPVGRSWQSVTAGYLALFGLLIWFLAPFAVWLGIWALLRARHGGHGRGRAIFAIIAGTAGMVIGTVVILTWV